MNTQEIVAEAVHEMLCDDEIIAALKSGQFDEIVIKEFTSEFESELRNQIKELSNAN